MGFVRLFSIAGSRKRGRVRVKVGSKDKGARKFLRERMDRLTLQQSQRSAMRSGYGIVAGDGVMGV